MADGLLKLAAVALYKAYSQAYEQWGGAKTVSYMVRNYTEYLSSNRPGQQRPFIKLVFPARAATDFHEE